MALLCSSSYGNTVWCHLMVAPRTNILLLFFFHFLFHKMESLAVMSRRFWQCKILYNQRCCPGINNFETSYKVLVQSMIMLRTVGCLGGYAAFVDRKARLLKNMYIKKNKKWRSKMNFKNVQSWSLRRNYFGICWYIKII